MKTCYNEGMEQTQLISIEELTGYSFFIPAYQRGYRWGKNEIDLLLEDISFYGYKETQQEDYCLQPLIVCPKATQPQEGFVVIDGQQRLTTMVLLLKYLGKNVPALSYETRAQASAFLQQYSGGCPAADMEKDDMNVLYMKSALQNIRSKLEEFQQNKDFQIALFAKQILHHVKFIWYQSAETNEVVVFSRINQSKIPLHNAELVKALLLARSSFPKGAENDALYEEKSSHIAVLWEDIERQMTGEFWYFLSQAEFPCHIELLLDLMAGRTQNAEHFFTFKMFENKLKQKAGQKAPKIQTPMDILQDIRRYFFMLMEWFGNKELYHYIGLLTILEGQTNMLQVLCQQWQKSRKKEDFQGFCLKKIADRFQKFDDVSDLDYQISAHLHKIKKILLYFNIAQVLQDKQEAEYIPFSQWKEWTLEHIYPQHPDGLKEEEKQQRLAGYEDFYNKHPYVPFAQEQLEKIAKLKQNLALVTADDINDLEPVSAQGKQGGQNGQDARDIVCQARHHIGNLALLPQTLNSSFSNGPFMHKRLILRENTLGAYVPPATLRAFLKFYSDDIKNYWYWSQADAQSYQNAIKKALETLQKEGKNVSEKDGI